MVSTPLKNISQNGNLPQIGVNIKNFWNHHPVIFASTSIAQVLSFQTVGVEWLKGWNQRFQWWPSKLLKLKKCSMFHVFWHEVPCLLMPSHANNIPKKSPWITSKTSIKFRVWFMYPCFLSSLNCLWKICQFAVLHLLALQWVLPRAWAGFTVITGSPPGSRFSLRVNKPHLTFTTVHASKKLTAKGSFF